MVDKTVVYFPDKSIRQGYASLFREMYREAVDSRWLTWQLFRRNFSATYRQSVLGIFWALLVPLASVGTFIYLNSAGILSTGSTSVPYPLFAVAGVALWQVFSVGLTLSTNSLHAARPLIEKINFPREAIVISAVAQGIIPSLIQTVVVFLLFAYYRISPPLSVTLVPLAMIPLVLLTLGLGFIFSLLNGVIRDIGNAISSLITFLVFVTPVLYTRPTGGFAAVATTYNPLYYLVAVPRDLLIFGSTDELPGFIYSAISSVIVFLLCWTAFHLTETKIAERM